MNIRAILINPHYKLKSSSKIQICSQSFTNANKPKSQYTKRKISIQIHKFKIHIISNCALQEFKINVPGEECDIDTLIRVFITYLY